MIRLERRANHRRQRREDANRRAMIAKKERFKEIRQTVGGSGRDREDLKKARLRIRRFIHGGAKGNHFPEDTLSL